MGRSTFQGPVRSLGGFYVQGSGTTQSITTTPVNLDVDTYSGRLIRVNLATCLINLPPIITTPSPESAGPGADPNTVSNVGALFTFLMDINAVSVVIKAQGADRITGSLTSQIAAGTVTGFVPTAGAVTTITLNGGTTGGLAGSIFTLQALPSSRWMIRDGNLIGAGAQVTPFS